MFGGILLSVCARDYLSMRLPENGISDLPLVVSMVIDASSPLSWEYPLARLRVHFPTLRDDYANISRQISLIINTVQKQIPLKT